MRAIFTAFFVTCFMFHVVAPANAQDGVSDDFYSIEGAGILSGKIDGGLGDGVWIGSERGAITTLVKGMPVTSNSHVIQRLTHAALLTKSNPQDLENADQVKPGQDLLSLRIYRLLDAGDYTNALKLFSAAPEAENYADIMKAGILAMIGSGQKSMACVEIKTLEYSESDAPFWEALNAYCDYTLSDAPTDDTAAKIDNAPYPMLKAIVLSPDFRFAYDAKAFTEFSRLERALLIGEQRISVLNLTNKQIAETPPAHLTALLAQDGLPEDQRILISMYALEYGLLETAKLTALYKGYSGNTLRLPQLYKAVNDEDGVERLISLLKEAMAMQDQYPTGAFLPFTRFFTQVEINNLTPSEMRLIATLFYKSGQAIPSNLVTLYLSRYDSQEKISSDLGLLAALLMMKGPSEIQNYNTLVQKIDTTDYADDFFVRNVIENLDKDDDNDDNAPKVYEKDFLLTAKEPHVMPTQAIRDRLNSVSQKKILGESVLLSIYVLHEIPVSEIYPGLYEELKRNYENIGLTDISRDLAIEGLLGMKE